MPPVTSHPAAAATVPRSSRPPAPLDTIPSSRLNTTALHHRSLSISHGAGHRIPRPAVPKIHGRRQTMGPGVVAAAAALSGPAPVLHPDFEYGDVTIVCHSSGGLQHAFRIPSAVLLDSCRLFGNLSNSALAPIRVEQAPADVFAFLRFLTTHPTQRLGLDLDFAQVHGVQRLVVAWRATPPVGTALVVYATVHAARLVGALGAEPERPKLVHLVRAAADLRITEIWHFLLASMQAYPAWRSAVDLGSLPAADIQALGPQAHDVLRFLYNGHVLPWEGLECSSVCRDQTGLLVVIKNFDGRQVMYSDSSL